MNREDRATRRRTTVGVAAVWGKLVTSSASKAGGQFVGVKSHKKKSEPIQQLLPVSQREMGDSVVPVVGRGPGRRGRVEAYTEWENQSK